MYRKFQTGMGSTVIGPQGLPITIPDDDGAGVAADLFGSSGTPYDATASGAYNDEVTKDVIGILQRQMSGGGGSGVPSSPVKVNPLWIVGGVGLVLLLLFTGRRK